MTDKTELDRVLEKIRKCLALGQSAEPHEAAAAMRQAQKLMDKYNVDHTTLEQAELGELKIRSRVSVSRVKPWEYKFMTMIATAFGCRVLWASSSSHADCVFGTWLLIGLKTQLTLAEYTADVLIKRLLKQRTQFMATLPTYLDRLDKAAQGDGFCAGWCEAVKATVHEFSGMAKLEPKLESYVVARWPSLSKAKTQSRGVGTMGREAGHEAGAGESLHRPMNGAGQRLLR